jgi:hypothetical protein
MESKLDTSLLDRQVELIVEAIYAGVFSGPNPQGVSFRHIINRVMILVQSPITFILLEKVSATYKIKFRFNKNKRHEARIEELVQQEVSSGGKNLFNLFDTEFYILGLIAEVGEKNKYDHIYDGFNILLKNESRLKNNVKSHWDNIAYKLESIFSKEKYIKNYGENFVLILHEAIKKCNESNLIKNPQLVNDYDENESKELFGKYLKSLTEDEQKYELNNDGLIDRVYKKSSNNLKYIADSEFLYNNDSIKDRLPNFLLFIRDYCVPKNYKRFNGVYDYNIRILMPSAQKNDVIKFLRGLLTRLLTANDASTKTAIKTEYLRHLQQSKDSNSVLLAASLNEFFWNSLQSKDGVVQVANWMDGALSINARSMADHVFDGVTMFINPFDGGGIKRCFPTLGDNETIPVSDISLVNEETRIDLQRLILCHYLFDAMAGGYVERDGKHLSIMLNPVELGGRIFGVIGYVTRAHDRYLKNPDPEKQDRYWRQNYHIYQDVNTRIIKHLRLYMERFYAKVVAEEYVECLMGMPTKTPLDDLTASINKRFSQLTSFLPYDKMVCKMAESTARASNTTELYPDAQHSNFTSATRDYHGELSLSADTPFPIAPGREASDTSRFVNVRDVAVQMTEEVKNKALKDYIEQEKRNDDELKLNNLG